MLSLAFEFSSNGSQPLIDRDAFILMPFMEAVRHRLLMNLSCHYTFVRCIPFAVQTVVSDDFCYDNAHDRSNSVIINDRII